MGGLQEDSEPITIGDLPVEVMVDIFEFLDAKSLLKASQVSHEWNKLVKNNEARLWSVQVKKKWNMQDLLLCGASWKSAFMHTHPRQLRKVVSVLSHAGDTVQPSLSDLCLSVLPRRLFQLTTIRRLYLYENRLTSLPPQITQLTNLRLLSLFRNKFTTIPESVLQLTHLEGLWLYDNELTAIPPAISRLTNLSFLHLSNNRIKEIPKEISSLQHLENLYLSGNQISAIPPELYKLPRLQTLLLNNNKLSEISPELSSLKHLTKLDLQQNNIQHIPEEVKTMPGVILNVDDNLSPSQNIMAALPSIPHAPPITFGQR